MEIVTEQNSTLFEINLLKILLSKLKTKYCDEYKYWINIAYILKNEGYSYEILDDWSTQSDKYDSENNKKIYNLLIVKDIKKHLTIKTLYGYLKKSNKNYFYMFIEQKYNIYNEIHTCKNISLYNIFNYLTNDEYLSNAIIFIEPEKCYKLNKNNIWIEMYKLQIENELFDIIMNTLHEYLNYSITQIEQKISKMNDSEKNIKQKSQLDKYIKSLIKCKRRAGNFNNLEIICNKMMQNYYKKISDIIYPGNLEILLTEFQEKQKINISKWLNENYIKLEKLDPLYPTSGKTLNSLYNSYVLKNEQIPVELFRSILESFGITNIIMIDGIKTKKSYYYGLQSKEEMKKIKLKESHNIKCKGVLCDNPPHKKYEYYCTRCYVNLFPEKHKIHNYKSKEISVKEYILSKYPDLSWKIDKKIEDGCSKRRPDMLLDLGYQVLIIEVDENQHRDYNCSCEMARTSEIVCDLSKKIVFIRFNPDSYKQADKMIKSCWKQNNLGINVISNPSDWQHRLQILNETVEYWLNPENIPNDIIETIELFYDS